MSSSSREMTIQTGDPSFLSSRVGLREAGESGSSVSALRAVSSVGEYDYDAFDEYFERGFR